MASDADEADAAYDAGEADWAYDAEDSYGAADACFAPDAENPACYSTLLEDVEALVRAERFCEAENLLYAAVEEGEPEALTAGLRFYSDLNALPDETLVRCNFPRDEILSGLQELCAACGYDLSVLDA